MQLNLFENVVLNATDKTGTTAGTYDYFAKEVGLSQAQMDELTDACKSGMVPKWKRRIRFVQQDLKSKGLICRDSFLGGWKITEKGKGHLCKAPAQSCRVYFVTKYGVAFWGDAATLSLLFKNEVDLIITSPPYHLTSERDYGALAKSEKKYVETLLAHIESWLSMLTSTASIVLNLGPSYKPGSACQSLYRERLILALNDKLGLKLIQKFTWWSPAKMPTGYWVTRAKKHCVNSTEGFYWLSLDPKAAKANNQDVLVDYSHKFKEMVLSGMARKGAVSARRPSGQSANNESFYALNKGAIPHDMLIDTAEGSLSLYSQHCKKYDLPRHPAMMPNRIPEFFVKYLTDKGNLVMDPFLGSAKVGAAAESLERFWAGTEKVRQYLDGALCRFESPHTPIDY